MLLLAGFGLAASGTPWRRWLKIQMLGLLLWEEGGAVRRLLARGALGTRPVPEAILLSTPNPRYQVLSGD